MAYDLLFLFEVYLGPWGEERKRTPLPLLIPANSAHLWEKQQRKWHFSRLNDRSPRVAAFAKSPQNRWKDPESFASRWWNSVTECALRWRKNIIFQHCRRLTRVYNFNNPHRKSFNDNEINQRYVESDNAWAILARENKESSIKL